MYDPHLKLPPSPPRPVHYSLFWKSLWGESVAWVLYWIHWPRIYRIRSLAHCVTNISYWLHLNEGFRCNGIKTNKYVICVLCVSDQVKWSIYDVIFVLKEKGEIALLLTVYYKLLTVYWIYTVSTCSLFTNDIPGS
jgi:hypothetical protein